MPKTNRIKGQEKLNNWPQSAKQKQNTAIGWAFAVDHKQSEIRIKKEIEDDLVICRCPISIARIVNEFVQI